MTKHEEIIMGMITHSGVAKSLAFEAIQAAKKSEFTKAKMMLVEGNAEVIEANKMHFSILSQQDKVDLNLLMIHAEDQMITSQLMLEIATEFIDLYKTIQAK